MSQVSIVDIESNNPQIPTSFTTDSGTAIPIANNLEILGGPGIITSASGKTVTVALEGSEAAIGKINVDASTSPGTNPVLPNISGGVTLTGAQVASGIVGTNVIRSNSLAASTATIEVQRAGSAAAEDITLNGVSHFDNTQFTVVNGFVSFLNGGANVQHLTGNSGGQLNPSGGNFDTVGSGSITIAGSGSTLTTQLTGLTNHAVLVGAGTATITKVAATANTGAILQNNSGADPSYSTATYPSTTTINQILYSSAANTVSGLATANQAVLTTGATGIPVLTGLATNGQLIIGSTSGVPAAATLTAGFGIAITNASNSITIAVTGEGFSWTDVTGATQTIAVENGYLTDRGGGVTYTLPSTASIGDTFKIIGKLGLATITPNANQQILIGSASGTVGVTGTAVATNVGDSITFVCTTSGASTVWRASSFVGNWTLS